MIDLTSITTGKSALPPRILLYGYEGIGKSTWAASAPHPVFIPTEDGLRQIDVPKFPLCHTYGEVLECLAAVCKGGHEFQTLVLDSLSGLEPMIWDMVCREYGAKSIDAADGGYGRGYNHALKYWREIVSYMDYANTALGMTIVLLAHVGAVEVRDAETATFDRTTPKLNKKAVALVSEWADVVMLAKQKYRVEKAKEGFNRERGIATPIGASGGERILRTVGNAAVDCKNRYCLPEELPFSWGAFASACAAGGAKDGVPKDN